MGYRLEITNTKSKKGDDRINNLTVKGNTTIGDAATDTISITGATTITGATSIVGNTGITGHLTPGANATYNIGSSSNKWQYLYINKTAYIFNYLNIFQFF